MHYSSRTSHDLQKKMFDLMLQHFPIHDTVPFSIKKLRVSRVYLVVQVLHCHIFLFHYFYVQQYEVHIPLILVCFPDQSHLSRLWEINWIFHEELLLIFSNVYCKNLTRWPFIYSLVLFKVSSVNIKTWCVTPLNNCAKSYYTLIIERCI